MQASPGLASPAHRLSERLRYHRRQPGQHMDGSDLKAAMFLRCMYGGGVLGHQRRTGVKYQDRACITKGGTVKTCCLCHAVILFLHALINFLPTRFLALWNAASTVWHIIGTAVLIILLPAVAPTHQSSAFVFTEFDSDTSASGVPSSG